MRKLSPKKPHLETTGAYGAPPDLLADERGQISIFFLLAAIPLIFLLALIFNTANQTAKKIETQGAADAAVLSGAVWEARGMNLLVLNNNAMAEVLSIMIVVRALKVTRRLTPLVALILAPVTAGVFVIPARIGAAASFPIDFVDMILNERDRLGWQALHILDRFNQVIRRVVPPIALFETYNYARLNSATFALLTTGKNFSFTSFSEVYNARTRSDGLVKNIAGLASAFALPVMPVTRNRPQAVALRAAECQLAPLSKLRLISNVALAPYTIAIAIALPIYQLMIDINLAELSGGENRSILDKFSNIFRRSILGQIGRIPVVGWFFNRIMRRAVSAILRALQPLRWSLSSNPPMPMLLTDQPQRSSSIKKEADVDLKVVRKYLQFLALTFEKRPAESPIGGRRFINENAVFLPGTQLTFAQAEIYNPTNWSMFSQDWRAKLAKATVFDEKFTDWSFANNH